MSASDDRSAGQVAQQDALTKFLDIKEVDEGGAGPHWSGTGAGGRGKTVPNAQYLVFGSTRITPAAIVVADTAHLTDRGGLEDALATCTQLQWYHGEYHGDEHDIAKPPDVWMRLADNEFRRLTLSVEVMSTWWSGMCHRWTLTDEAGTVVEQIDTDYDQAPDV
ncbi:hypothetical protein PP613_23655 [Mycobacteroides abscessus]|nr:hypothetical protein [Mycobacteroides abscessus]MDM2412340.1 hypothetical protein [Mycobacteroides abscessus]